MRKLCRPPTVGATLSAAVLACCCLAQSTPPVRETLELRDGGTVEAESGRVEVPENRGASGSRPISLAFLRVRSPLLNPGPPVFMLAGGPGGSSIEMVRRHVAGGGRTLLEALGGDIVAIDQRGVGLSQPNLESATLYELAIEQPGDPAKMLDRIRRVCREEAQRWRERGVDLAGYTTVESADDIDAVRQFLGYDQIVLWGESYGSHLALAAIRRHPARIARAVLIGPEGPDDTLKLPSDAQAVLERVDALVRADAAWGAALPDFCGSLSAVLKQLDAAPAYAEVDGVQIGIRKFDVQWLIASKLPRTRRGIDELPALVKAMSGGDFSGVARELAELRRTEGVGSAMQMVMDSASGVSKARAARIAREARDCLLGDAMNFPFPNVAEAWGAPDLGEDFRKPLRADTPVLIVVGDLDSRTPVRAAVEMLEHLPGGRLLIVENVSHDLPWGVRDIRHCWQDFLAGREVRVNKVTAPRIPFTGAP